MRAYGEIAYFSIGEFNNLLQEKVIQDKKVDRLKALIKKNMDVLVGGLVIDDKPSLKIILRESQHLLPEAISPVINAEEASAIVCDEADTILDISPHLMTSLGYQPADLIGSYKGKLWVERPDMQETGQAADTDYIYSIYKVKQKHFPAVHEDAYITREGHVIPVLQHQLNVVNHQGRILGFLYLVINLSEVKALERTMSRAMEQIERELLHDEKLELTHEMKIYLSKDILETREYLNNILETSIDGILITSISGHILGCNQAFRKMVRYAEDELINQPITLISPLTGTYQTISGKPYTITEQDVLTMADTLNTLFEKERRYASRQYFKNRDGALIPTEVNLSLLKNREGELIGILRNIHNLTEREKLEQKIRELSETYRLDNIVGKSRAMQEIFRLLKKVAESESTVLVQGESGTGKELIARAVYHHSPRNKGPFVTLNCGAIPYNLLESELFGHVKGAFTGAIRDKKGLFEEAAGGVIFLDEIGELPLEMQVKLLRAIQQREIKRVGDNRNIAIDVRIIAAANKDLFEETKKGLFREDLYYRINVFALKIPPLRQRKEDIPLLIDFFLKKSAARGAAVQVSREAMKVFLDYSFPGNVRELENIIERALILCEDNIITVSDLPPEMMEAVQGQRERPRKNAEVLAAVQPAGAVKRKDTEEHGARAAEELGTVLRAGRQQAEKEIIMQALHAAEHNKAQAAKLLKIGRTSLYRKMKQMGIA